MRGESLRLCDVSLKTDYDPFFFFSEPIIEDGEAEVEVTLSKDGESFITSCKCLSPKLRH